VSSPPRATGSFIDLFSAHADAYAAARPRYPQALFDFIADHAPARRRAWDGGCGNGQAAVALASRFDAVDASDPSAEQIAQALPHERVIYAVQPTERTHYPDASFDAVCVAQALHWFDHARFWAEARRVMKPGALFAAWGYSWMRVSPDFDAAMQRELLAPLQALWAPQNALLWAGYRGIDVPFNEQAAPSFEIRLDWSLTDLLAYVLTWSAVRNLLARDGPAAFEAIATRLAPHWGDAPEAPRTVTMPLAMRVGRKPA
jgi:SAM-dependent methyltransferase